jgi:hypothetical protein
MPLGIWPHEERTESELCLPQKFFLLEGRGSERRATDCQSAKRQAATLRYAAAAK